MGKPENEVVYDSYEVEVIFEADEAEVSDDFEEEVSVEEDLQAVDKTIKRLSEQMFKRPSIIPNYAFYILNLYP